MASPQHAARKPPKRILMRHSKDVLVAVAFLVSMAYALYFYAFSDSRLSLCFAALIILIDLILYAAIDRLYNKGKLNLNVAFVIILAFLGILFCAVFAPGTVPDEAHHYLATYRYSNYVFFEPISEIGLTMRIEDIDFLSVLDAPLLERSDYFDIANSGFFVQDASTQFIERPEGSDFGSNMPQLRLVPAIGIVLGRLLGLGSYPLFYLGRLFNLALFIALVYFAVRIMPFGKNAMRIAALLPMTLHLVSSYSYDSAIIGIAFLLIAFSLRAIYGNGPIETKTCVAIIALTFLLAPCKIVYLMISFLAFLIPSTRFSCKRNACLFKFGVIGIGILAIALTRIPAIISISGVGNEEYVVSREGTEGHYYTLTGMLAEPLKLPVILVKTMFVMGDAYFSTLLGRSLAWFQNGLEAPWYLVFLFGIVLLASALATPDDDRVAKPSHRVLFIVIAAISWTGILVSMLFAWTFDTSPVIQGVQGRYFLPLLPLALLAIRSKTFICTRNISWALIFGMLMLNSIYMMQVFSTALTI